MSGSMSSPFGISAPGSGMNPMMQMMMMQQMQQLQPGAQGSAPGAGMPGPGQGTPMSYLVASGANSGTAHPPVEGNPQAQQQPQSMGAGIGGLGQGLGQLAMAYKAMQGNQPPNPFSLMNQQPQQAGALNGSYPPSGNGGVPPMPAGYWGGQFGQ